MRLVTFVCCLLLVTTGASAGVLSIFKSKPSGAESTNKVAPIDASQPVPVEPGTDKLLNQIEIQNSYNKQSDSTGDKITGVVENNPLIDAESQKPEFRLNKDKKPKDAKKAGKKALLPENADDHPVQVVASSESVPLPTDGNNEDLHIVPDKKKKKKPGSTPENLANPENHEDSNNHDTVAVITEEKLDAAVDKMKTKQDKSYNKDPELQDLIKRAKEVKSERAYLKKLVLAYSATQAFLSATDVIPFRDPVIFTVIKIVTYLKNVLQKPLCDRYAEHQRVYSGLVTEMLKNDPKYNKLIQKMPKKLVIKTKDGKDIVVDIIDEKEALKEDKLNLEKMNFVSLFHTGMQMK